jgi:hypothetical protein
MQRRTSDGALNLYPADDSRGWRVIRVVSFSDGLEKVASGDWMLVDDVNGNPWYFQLKANFTTDQDLPSGASSSSITESECKLNAGCGGKSRTMGMSEDRRLCRRDIVSHALPPEDAVERAINKVKMWPHPASRIDDGTGIAVYGDRAVRVYPRLYPRP